MIARYYPIALTLPDGPDRTVVATVVGVDHALAQDLLAEVRAIVVASGRSQVEAAEKHALALTTKHPHTVHAPDEVIP